MKSNIAKIALLGAMVLMVVALGFGQSNTITNTYLSAAATATTATISVGSATGITASPQTMLMIDQEPMRVTSVSGTTITVSRDQSTAAAQVIYSRVHVGRPRRRPARWPA